MRELNASASLQGQGGVVAPDQYQAFSSLHVTKNIHIHSIPLALTLQLQLQLCQLQLQLCGSAVSGVSVRR